MRLKFILSVFLFLAIQLFSQPGKLGNLTVNANMIVNSYCPVTSNISAGTNSVTVLAQSTMLNLCPGDLIMIYQAQGATISNTNSVNYGSVTANNNSGMYEFNYVKSVSGNVIVTTNSIVNNYTATGMVQVIKVPLYITLSINSGFKILARNWKDTVVSTVRYRFGGVTAIHAINIINNGTITASGAGFRGGVADTINYGFNYTSFSAYTSSLVTNGGEKGESIAGFQQEYDLLGGRYGRGAASNGGGGGNGWNSGGGGGANANNGNTWTGQGVMSNSVTGSTAWTLDPGYISNGNSLTNSSGGGRGGYSVGFSSLNPTIVGPNNGSWGADGRKEVGGLGGRPLTNINPVNRIYFGGGGGAGDDNNNCTKNGGNGGGIVYIYAPSGISGNGIISSNGENGGDSKNAGLDATSGAGAGGSVLLISGFISTTQTVTAIGGRGGNQVISSSEFEGPGGGGGGGYIASTFGPLTTNVSGGANGTTNSSLMSAFPANGATAAANGQFAVTAIPFISYDSNSILNLTTNSPICAGNNLNLNVSSLSGAVYSWAGPNGFSSIQQNPVILNAQTVASGVYSLAVAVAGCSSLSATIPVTVYPNPVISVSGSSIICTGTSATLSASGASTYTWNGTINSPMIILTPTINSIYTVNGTNINGCTSTTTVQVFVDDCLGINEVNSGLLNVQIYPNPASFYLQIENSNKSEFNIMLYNSLGQLVFAKNNNLNSLKLDVKSYPKGIYYVVIVSGRNKVNQKIVLE